MIENHNDRASAPTGAQSDKTTDVKTENAAYILNPSEGREKADRHMNEYSQTILSTKLSDRERAREELRYETIEWSVIFDSKGNEVRRIRGTGYKLYSDFMPNCRSDQENDLVAWVDFSDEDDKVLESIGDVLLHNHPYPDRYIFSKTDIGGFLTNPAYSHLKETEVVTVDGSWILTRRAPIQERKAVKLLQAYSNYLNTMIDLSKNHVMDTVEFIVSVSCMDGASEFFSQMDEICVIGAVNQVVGLSNGRLTLSFEPVNEKADMRIKEEVRILDKLNQFVSIVYECEVS